MKLKSVSNERETVDFFKSLPVIDVDENYSPEFIDDGIAILNTWMGGFVVRDGEDSLVIFGDKKKHYSLEFYASSLFFSDRRALNESIIYRRYLDLKDKVSHEEGR